MKNISFEEYLKIDAVNFSLLKSVADSGRFYNSEKKSKKSLAMDLGTVVDELLLPTDIPEEFFIIKGEPLTSSTLVLGEKMVEYCKLNNIKYEEVNNELILQVLDENKLWSKQGVDKKLEKFVKNEDFYNYLEGNLTEKIAINQSTLDKAHELSNILKLHDYTKKIFDRGLNQMVYVFEMDGVKYKIRLDKLIIDDENKKVKPFDLKTGAFFATQFDYNFYKLRYYLQQSLYQLGVLHYIKNHLPDYEIDNFKFVYISTTEPYPYPVIYEMSEKWAELGYHGSTHKGRYHKGVKELTQELLFYEKVTKEFDREIYMSKGEVLFPLPI
ncbi:MAG: PD-(D/E)XK nuclease-like domain-containing protein [Nanoarchaeota archaeon]